MSCNTRKKGIFEDAYKKRLEWNRESDNFLADCEPFIRKHLAEIPGFEEFKAHTSLYISFDKRHPGWMQIWFGSRPLGRPAPTGRSASERGPWLIYSRGPSGEMSIMMKPIASEVARVPEDSLMLGIGYYDYWALHLGLKQHLRDLIAYAYVSSIDTKPTRAQALRIWWLRRANDQHIDGKHTFSPLNAGIKNIVKLVIGEGFSGVVGFVMPVLLGWMIGHYGTDWLKDFFIGK